MDIAHPRRILAVGAIDSGLTDLLKGLTGSSPEPTDGSIAGLSHSLSISTAYYKAEVPIWLDEISDAESWASEFLTDDAKEVLGVVGAFVVAFRKPVDEEGLEATKGLIKAVARVCKEGCGFSWDGVALAVAMPQGKTKTVVLGDEWEDFCQDEGFESVDWEASGKNEFGERMGVERVKEALEANEWAGEDDEELDMGEFEDDDGSVGFNIEAAEMMGEVFDMKRAIYGNGDDEEGDGEGEDEDDEASVEKLEAMMLKLQAVKEMGEGLPEVERRRLAARAVNEIMKDVK